MAWFPSGRPTDRAFVYADAILAAGFVKPRVITTVEYCRQCRDSLPYGSNIPRADFILWGMFFPSEAFGPKCYTHASEWFNTSRVDQYAVYDLRPIHALIPEPTA